MRPWHAQPLDELIKKLKTSATTGLDPVQAKARLVNFGPNAIPSRGAKTAFEVLRDQFHDFMVQVLLVAAVLSALLMEWSDALAIIAIVILNAGLGFIQEYRTERSLAALGQLSTPQARVRRGAITAKRPANEIVPGDLIILTAGDKVPADARLVQSWNFQCDESSLTGESTPVSKEVSVLPTQTGLAERCNMVFAASLVTRGKAEAIVVATGTKTETGQIARLLGRRKEEQTPLQQRLHQLGQVLVAVCLAVCLVVVILGLKRKGPTLELIMAGISLAVAAIPEGLPAVVTLSLAVGVQRMAKRQAIIRVLPAVETLGCASVICADKTGTLTENKMTVREISAQDHRLLLCLAALCNNASLTKQNIQPALEQQPQSSPGEKVWVAEGDPTEAALVVKAAEAGLVRGFLEQKYPRLGEIPFDSERKCMSTLHQFDAGVRLVVKGAPDIVLARCCSVYNGPKSIQPIGQETRENWLKKNEQMASRALRVLAVAYRDLRDGFGGHLSPKLENNLTLVGLVGLNDPPRQGVKEAIYRCQQAGIRTIMITGDHRATAVAVAKELGLAWQDGVATGTDLDGWSQAQLEDKVRAISIYARVSPRHKFRIVRALRRRAEVVAMTGDGINDAPAMKEADIGIAMGRTGTDVARETADMVIEDDNFTTIVAAVEEGRVIYDNIRKFIRYLLSSNTGEVVTMLVAALLGLPLPLLPIQILWVNLLTDGLPALALGFDPPAKNIMERQPRKKTESIFSRGLSRKIIVRGLTMGLFTVAVFILGLMSGDLLLARTMAFTVLVMHQLFHVLECRSESHSVFAVGLLGNPYLLLAVALSFGLQLAVLYQPVLRQVFATVPLTIEEWGLIVLVAGFNLLVQGLFWAFQWTERRPLDIMGNNT
ncbi:MAG: calcium-translocating P-type ATPase, PMCA-type [Firmicutes bacterium]|nr:calcium-translocating P-type ATPase, PMCA-type [Bacillota bacterium]